MVLESLIEFFNIKCKNFNSFILGFIFATVGLFLSLWIFRSYASLVMIFFCAMGAIPLMYNLINEEEKREFDVRSETKLLKSHFSIIKLFMFLFLGFLVSSTFWFTVLPTDLVKDAFSIQINTLSDINPHKAYSIKEYDFKNTNGNVIKDIENDKYNKQDKIYNSANNVEKEKYNINGYISKNKGYFRSIIINNFKVLFISIVFSFIYGAGAIFVLSWNAAVIGTAIGFIIRNGLTHNGFANALGIVSNSFFKYIIHGIPEVMAYFTGALAAGILSVAIIKKHYRSNRFKGILMDSMNLLIISMILIIIAGILEVFVTPLFF